MAVTYFGRNQEDVGSSDISNYSNWNNTIEYTCPGVGTQLVKELGARARYTVDPANIRVALYDASENFICQGDAQISVNDTSFVWFTHTAFSDVADDPIVDPEITGGTTYKIIVSGDGSGLKVSRETVTSGEHVYKGAEYTEGYPATLQGLSRNNSTSGPDVRCGVEPESGGATYTPSATDGIAFSDSSSRIATLQKFTIEGIRFSDSSTELAKFGVGAVDGIAFSDTSAETAIFIEIATDGLAFGDETDQYAVFQVSAVDGIAFSDAPNEIAEFLTQVLDGVAFSDDSNRQANLLKTVIEGLAVGDYVSKTYTPASGTVVIYIHPRDFMSTRKQL